MTREEQIKLTALEFAKITFSGEDCLNGENDDYAVGFITGAKWSDENLISYKEYIDARKEIIEETIAWMKTIVIQETANGYAERLISDNMIEEYKKVIGYEN